MHTNKSSNKHTQSQKKYDKANTQRLYFKLNVKTDADILERLNKVPSKQGYIKQLIRDDIAQNS